MAQEQPKFSGSVRYERQVQLSKLRRKHIQRFWAEQEAKAHRAESQSTETHSAGGQPALPFLLDLTSLRIEFGEDAILEALAHALLDHFKDDWGVPESAAQPLKETLLTLLRGVAISYHLRDVWTPPDGRQIEEGDLDHTQEVANFLIQQTENAPLKLAQALLIDPQQGLPRLACGQLTRLEQECRRMAKQIAGVSQQKVNGGEAGGFTFRIRAPFQPDLDPIEPENLAEAQRIASLPPKNLRLTARGKQGPVGFISELPEIL